MVVFNQHMDTWQLPELQAGPSGIFETILAFEIPIFIFFL